MDKISDNSDAPDCDGHKSHDAMHVRQKSADHRCLMLCIQRIKIAQFRDSLNILLVFINLHEMY